MLRNLVIPLDGSEFAALALPTGIELAATAGASVRVIGIAPTDAEMAWTYDHVHDQAKQAGLDEGSVEIRVDPEPLTILLELADVDGNVLCLATHDRVPPAAKIAHAVGSTLLERAKRPLIVVGRNVSSPTPGTDVVVGVDGVGDPEPLLAVAAGWAGRLRSRLRIVTVYEPAAADLRRPEHFTRRHGPPVDADLYLATVREYVADAGLDGVDTVAIADPVSVSAGLEQHLVDHPARLLVLGGHRAPPPSPGVVRHVLPTATVPLLIVNQDTPSQHE